MICKIKKTIFAILLFIIIHYFIHSAVFVHSAIVVFFIPNHPYRYCAGFFLSRRSSPPSSRLLVRFSLQPSGFTRRSYGVASLRDGLSECG